MGKVDRAADSRRWKALARRLPWMVVLAATASCLHKPLVAEAGTPSGAVSNALMGCVRFERHKASDGEAAEALAQVRAAKTVASENPHIDRAEWPYKRFGLLADEEFKDISYRNVHDGLASCEASLVPIVQRREAESKQQVAEREQAAANKKAEEAAAMAKRDRDMKEAVSTLSKDRSGLLKIHGFPGQYPRDSWRTDPRWTFEFDWNYDSKSYDCRIEYLFDKDAITASAASPYGCRALLPTQGR